MMNVKKNWSTNQIMKWIILAALAVFLLLMLMPFILVTINAIKTEPEFARFGPLSLPKGINLTSLEDFWVRANFSRALFNSTFISLWVAKLADLLSLLKSFFRSVCIFMGWVWLLVFFLW